MDKDSILRESLYLNLATVCDDGSPWNTPLFYVYDGDKLYWWSPKNAKHSHNIVRDSRAFITVYDSGAFEGDGLGVYLQGLAKEVDTNDIEAVLGIYRQKAHIFKLTKDDCTGDAPTRLYQFAVQKAWRNGETEENGMYIDRREDVV